MAMSFATVDEVIELWLEYSGERWDRERRGSARTHPWPRYLTQFTVDELSDGAIQLLASTQPFTWGFWYRRTRRLAVGRLGPIPPGLRITRSAKPTRSSASPSGQSAAEKALEQAQAALEAGDPERALTKARQAISEEGTLPSTMTAVQAADIVLAAFLSDVNDLRGLTDAATAAEGYLESLAPLDSKHRRTLQGHLTCIAAVKVNLRTGTSSSLARVCSLLRKPPFRRPDLGLLAADAALEQKRQNAAALTTKGAALIDLGKLHQAQTALEEAWDVDDKNPYAAVTLCRLHLKGGATTEALHWAERALGLDPTSEHARRTYLAAQLAAGELIGQIDLDALDDDRTPTVSRFDAVQAAQQLAQEGQTDRACEALHEILELAPDYAPAVWARADLDC